jgi:TetR/AcrR family transcriptional repressor of nem operon
MSNSRLSSKDQTRSNLLGAATLLIRSRGFEATSIADLCSEAGVTKGAFFHHFKDKEHMAVEAVNSFSSITDALEASAQYQTVEDPLKKLLGYVDFRIEILSGPISASTCLLGTMIQEVHETHPVIRDACERCLDRQAKELSTMIESAKERYNRDASWTAEDLAHHIQAVIQGALILAKAKQGPEVAIDCLLHLRRYVKMLFVAQPVEQAPKTPTSSVESERSSRIDERKLSL